MRLLDREIARKAGRYYGIVVAISVSLLLLESAPRVLAASARLGEPLLASILVLAGLVPEYLVLAGMFGIYAAGATLAYRLARRNELAGWSAAGVSTPRMTAAYILLALLNAGMILAMLGWLQPQGAVGIAEVDRDVALGRYGMALDSGVPTPIGHNAIMVFDHVEPDTGLLQGVFVRLPGRTVTSREALVGVARGNAVKIAFRDGLVIDEQPAGQAGGKVKAMRFARMDMVVPHDGKAVIVDDLEPFQKLVPLPKLLALAGDVTARRDIRTTAWAEALYRLTIPLLSLLLAWLGFVLGLPDRVHSNGAAVMLGIGLIVLAWRLADLVRSLAPGRALAADAALLAAMAACCWLATFLNRRFGQGFIDRALMRVLRRARASLARTA